MNAFLIFKILLTFAANVCINKLDHKMTSTIKSFIKGIVYFWVLWVLTINAQTVKIKLIETSDVHGTIMPFDLVGDSSISSSLSQVHSYANFERRLAGQKVILLDNGDILQGDPLVYYYNYENTSNPHIYAEAMNFMKYDAATVGNHDIETGHPVYDKFNREINFPWLAANAINTETGEPYFKPYTVVEKAGVRVAILGLITPAIPQWLPEILWEGIEFEDMIVSAKNWVNIIKENEDPDLLVGLFHSGVDYTYNNESKETYRNENASRLVAEQVPGFDVVFVGHDHASWNFKTANIKGDSVLIVGPLSRAKTVAVAIVTMNYNSSKHSWEREDIVGEMVNLSNYKPDDDFMSKFTLILKVVGNYVSKPLGRITRDVTSKESLFGPSEFVDLVHSFQLEETDADISFVSPLSFNTQIDSGWIRVKDMFKLYRYENFLYTMELGGQEIKDYLEYSFAGWFNEMGSIDDHLLNFKRDQDGNIIYSGRTNSPMLDKMYYNFSNAAGIYYTVDITKPKGERVKIKRLSDDSVFKLDNKYTVAINSYRGNGGGGHLTRGAGLPMEELSTRVVSSTDKDLRYYMMRWIENKGTVTPMVIGNWRIVPEGWWKKGKEKDFVILFGSE
jgi:2',3'-cyclic-nucleotide 2'-phosphodiesterase/3'-nucleotidase